MPIAVSATGGVLWLIAAQFLAGGVLIAVPIRWAVPLFATVVVAAVLMTYAERQRQWAWYMGMTTLVGGLTIAILVWLTRMVRQAQAARVQLAEQSVIAERLRIDAQLARSVTAALETIVAAGQRAAAGTDPEEIAAELAALVTFSRQTLTETRHLLAGYQVASAEAELQTAVALVRGAGIDATLLLASDDIPAVLDTRARAELRSAVARILADDTVGSCVMSLSSARAGEGAELRFDVRCFNVAGQE